MGRGKRPFSARFSIDVVERLDNKSELLGQSRARLAERLLDEGLRMDEFPGITFRAGPTGRRAGLVGGPDVWEIIRDLKNARDSGASNPLMAVSEASHLERSQVELAAAYYGSYNHEIEERIRLNEEAAERMRRAFEISEGATVA